MKVALHLPPLFSPVSIVQVVDFYICNSSTDQSTALIHFYTSIPRFILGVILFILALIPALNDAIGMYKATRQWQSNKYLQQLMRDGIFYFFMYVSLFPLSVSLPYIPSYFRVSTQKLTNHIP